MTLTSSKESATTPAPCFSRCATGCGRMLSSSRSDRSRSCDSSRMNARCVSRSRFFSRLALMRARSSTGSNALGRWSSAPSSMARTTLSSSPCAEMTMTGTSRSAGSAFICASTSWPSISGMTMSSSTRSNGWARSSASPSAPVEASVTE